MGMALRKKGKRTDGAEAELEAALRELKGRLAQAYANFNAAGDGELLESYIYEIQALQTRYSWLLRQRKSLDAPAAPVPALPGTARDALPVA